MSPVTNMWRQLVQRRLWPVAIVLIAALAAVPLLLAKDPEPPASPPAVNIDTKGELAATPIVAPATDADQHKRRKVLGRAKNPFGTTKPPDAPSDSGDDAGPTVLKTPSEGTPDSGSSAGGGTAPSAPVPAAPVAPVAPVEPAEPKPAPKRYAPEELTVRFGGGEDAGGRMSVKVGDPLPSAETPVLIYTGLLKDGKTAEFLVDAGVTAIGDGECKPSPDACETIRLKAGETEFLDVVDETGAAAQYQLDLLKVHNPGRHATSSRTKSVDLKSGSRRSELRSVTGRVSALLP